MTVKIPSREEYERFDGRSCHQLWAQLGDSWTCPSCSRTKFEIMRWMTIVDLQYQGPGKKHLKGWSANLHRHHDHAQSNYADFGLGRFKETIICCDCNSADASAKRRLGLPKNFNFSPEEIKQFVYATPHGKHKIYTMWHWQYTVHLR